MFKFIKNISLPVLFCFSLFVSANETNVEVNMESILEVGRENQTLSANSQDKIDQTERQTDAHREPERHRDREKERQRDRKADRQDGQKLRWRQRTA